MSAHESTEFQLYYLLLIQSSTGTCSHILLPISEDLDPGSFAKAILAAYKVEFGKIKRLYYRCLLLKKPTVSITANLTSGSPCNGNVVIKASVEDETLMSAMKDPKVLSNIDPESFFKEYEAIAVDPCGRNAPQKAIMISFARDKKLAAQVAGGMVTLAVSVAAKLLDTLVIGI